MGLRRCLPFAAACDEHGRRCFPPAAVSSSPCTGAMDGDGAGAHIIKQCAASAAAVAKSRLNCTDITTVYRPQILLGSLIRKVKHLVNFYLVIN